MAEEALVEWNQQLIVSVHLQGGASAISWPRSWTRCHEPGRVAMSSLLPALAATIVVILDSCCGRSLLVMYRRVILSAEGHADSRLNLAQTGGYSAEGLHQDEPRHAAEREAAEG